MLESDDSGLNTLIENVNSAIKGAVSVGDNAMRAYSDFENWGTLISPNSKVPAAPQNASGVAPAATSHLNKFLSGGVGVFGAVAAVALLILLALRR